jgi:hypothetical protein
MRVQKLVVATVWMAGVAWPGLGEPRPAPDLRVPVCMDYRGGGDLRAPNLATAIASKMFRRIGVTLVWVVSGPCPPDGIRISLTGNTPETLQPGALAYALPYEGTHIRVFRDRIWANQPALVPHLLAHVLVHEIIHILQGVNWHSGRGVMKVHWNRADISQMLWSELPIAQEDIDRVHAGMEKRAQLAAAHRNQGSLADNPAPTLVAASQLP